MCTLLLVVSLRNVWGPGCYDRHARHQERGITQRALQAGALVPILYPSLIQVFFLFFCFFFCFKCWTTNKWSTLSSSVTSHVVVRGWASVILSVGHCRLLMADHCTPRLHGSHLLCTTSWTTTSLYVSSFWTKCVVYVASYLCYFMIHFELE